MKQKICKAPSCYLLVDEGSKYCKKHFDYEKHKPIYHKAISKPYENADKPNQHLYNTYRWHQLRKKVVSNHPYCCICGSTERLSADHIIPPKGNEELFFDEGNLQVLCFTCHNKKTRYEVNNH